MLRKIRKVMGIVLLIFLGILIFLLLTGMAANAAGLVDTTVSDVNEYSKYPMDNYQLDFYVDTSWSWLPWNWVSSIGKNIQYGLYAITNFIWTVSLYISNATGYVVQEAYKLDFIGDTANAIGTNIQTLAGVTQNGFSTEGFYVGFLLILILILGIYVAYTGLLKRETTKAVHAVVNFLTVFILSAAFIAYAPDYITKINEFSADVSNAALSLGTKIVLPNTSSKGKDSVDLIRDSLFAVQVKQPWLLLQYGESDLSTLGVDRVEKLLSASPDDDAREDAVIEEIENNNNMNLSVTKTISRLGTVVFLFFFNIGISIFVFLLTGMMIFSQVLFIIYAMFLPISFLLSMIPTYESMGKKALTKLFNTIMLRAGITLIITTAFSISTMFYSISNAYPFFMVAFLQIVTFAGIYFKLSDLLGMFSLQGNDTQQLGRRIMRKPNMLLNRQARRMRRQVGKTLAAGGIAGAAGAAITSRFRRDRTRSGTTGRNQDRSNRGSESSRSGRDNIGSRAGARIGAVLDTKDRVKDKVRSVGQQAKDMPVRTRYALQNGKKQVKKNASDLKWGIEKERALRMQGRADRQEQYRQTTAGKRAELEQAKQSKTKAAKPGKPVNPDTPMQKRPNVKTSFSGASAEKTVRTESPTGTDILQKGKGSVGTVKSGKQRDAARTSANRVRAADPGAAQRKGQRSGSGNREKSSNKEKGGRKQ